MSKAVSTTACYHRFTAFRAVPKWARGPIFCEVEELAATHEREKQLTREIALKVETALPEKEVLAVELTKPDGFTVFIDDVRGVDHALCARVTHLLADYQREWEMSVSSPGLERPLRTPQHFRNVVGRRVALTTETKRRLRGEGVHARERAVAVQTVIESLTIPCGTIVRGNLIEEVYVHDVARDHRS